MLSSGKLSPDEVADSLTHSDMAGGDVPNVTDGFLEFEDGFESYPALIYDGPFSDHIMTKKSELTESLPEVSEGTAKATAAKALGVTIDMLNEAEGESGRLEAFAYSTDTASISISRRGGLIIYMLKNRNPTASSVSQEDAIKHAERYLDRLDIDDMKVTYYETLGNVCTINFAYGNGDVTVYNDLIKVKVALDNGEILGFDARGFIMNHRERDFDRPKLSESEARKSVSSKLNIKNVKLCSIPLEDTTEGYCYEFTCENKHGNHVLVYIDCDTGRELEILMLFESETGVLAM